MRDRGRRRRMPNNPRHGLFRAVVGLLLLACIVPALAASPESMPVVPLTTEERAWLAAHPDITFGYTDAFEPAVIVNPDGSYRGTLVDFLDLLNQRLGTDFKITVKPIPVVFGQVSRKELAGILALHPDNADKRGYLKTQDYTTSYPTVFTRKGVAFTGPDDLAGKKIAIIDSVFFSQNMVDRYGDGSTIIKVKSALEGLERVKDSTADLFIGSSRNSYLMVKYQFFDLAASFQFYDHPTHNVMAIRSDWPQLVSILNKGLAAISVEEMEAILRKWVRVPELNDTLELTDEERDWVDKNPRINVGIYPVPPYMYMEDGRFTGYLVDMMQRLASQAGLTAQFSMQPLAETLSKVKSGQAHVVLGMIHSQERAGFMDFSENVMNMQMSVFARASRSDISDIASLENKTIASYNGYGFEPVLKKYLPNAKIIRANDAEGMLRLVASGEADAAVQELHSGEFILRDSFINAVNRKEPFDPPGFPTPTGSEFAVSRKFPLLNSILNKSYAAMPVTKRNSLWRFWFGKDGVGLLQHSGLILSAEERLWLEEHPVITLGGGNFPPLEFFDEVKGQSDGVGPDYAKLIGRMLGIEFKLVSGDWQKILDKAKAKEIDGIRLIYKSKEREQYLNFTKPYLKIANAIITQKKTRNISSLKDLTHKRVGTLQGIFAHRYIEEHYPDIDIIGYPTWEKVLRALVSNEVDAIIGTLPATTYMINKLFITNLKVAALPPELDRNIHLGIRPDWPELVTIINKAIVAITEKKHSEIKNKWITLYPKAEDNKKIALTTQEKTWLNQNHNVRVRATDWPPYLIVKGNEPPQGIAIEYLKLIEERTGITFDFEVTDQPFAEFLEQMQRHQGPDMTALIVQSPEREQYLSFTAPYVSSPYVIFAREQDDLLLDINGLTGKTLAVPRGFVIQAQLARDYPDIRQALFDSDEQALRAVATGQVDAYIGNLTVASHIIHQHGLSDLRVAAPSPFVQQSLSMGNRKDWPELTAIIDKALASITEAEKTAIRSKYVALRYEQGVDRADVMRWILIVVGGAFGIVIIFVFWNRSLGSKVDQRTRALQQEVNVRKQAEQKLEAHQERLKALASQLALAEEKERQRIAIELHDQVGQSLAFARMRLASAKKNTANEKSQEILNDVSASLLQAVQDTRHVIYDLSSPAMHEIGLRAAIAEWLEEEVQHRHGIQTAFIDKVDPQRKIVLPLDIRALMFRNVRELITNAVKHAQATQITVCAENTTDDIVIMVEDDGVGFEITSLSQIIKKQGSFGIFSIKERMANLGGSLELLSEPGKGCQAILRMPLVLGEE